MQRKCNENVCVALLLCHSYNDFRKKGVSTMRGSRCLEFKAEITSTFLKTVSAYANYGNGIIKFGINDDGTIGGIEEPESACLDIENRINDSIHPVPDYTLSINRKHNVITLRVSEGRYKPYLYKGKAYKRNDSSTIEADQLELKRLTLEGSNMYYEELPGSQNRYTFKCLEEKLVEKLGVRKCSDDMLRTLGFYTQDGHINIAGELFADRNSFCGIDIARFGNSIDEILERQTFSNMSILKQYDEAAAMFLRYYQYERIEGFERKQIEIIPQKAFREAIANALVHRTWDIRSHIRISMWADRIEVSSPGGLPGGITEEEYLNGMISVLRNPVIGNVFFRMHYIEMFGTGIRRIKEAYEAYTVKPQFHITDHSITVILPVIADDYSVTTDGKKVIDLLDSGLLLSSSEIALELGWSRDKAIRTVNSLKNSGCLRVMGSGRGTRYCRMPKYKPLG